MYPGGRKLLSLLRPPRLTAFQLLNTPPQRGVWIPPEMQHVPQEFSV